MSGRALVKLYSDPQCKVEMPRVNGSYSIDTRNYQEGKQMTFEFKVYLKNVGDYKAYYVSLTEDPIERGIVTSVTKDSLAPDEIAEVDVKMIISALPYDIENVNVRLNYDSIQYRG